MDSDAKKREEILAFLTKWAQAYFQKDPEALVQMCVPDPSFVLIGTGTDEIRKGTAQYRKALDRDFKEAQSISMSYSDLSFAWRGEVAWFSASCQCRAYVEGSPITLEGRFSGVLEERDGSLLLAQGHFSVPDSRQAAGHSFPEADSVNNAEATF